MKNTPLSAEEIVERGTRLYDERLRALLEPEHNGKYIIIDVETGEYEMDSDHLTASDRAWAKRPGAPLYATRVGSRTLARIGGRWKADAPLTTPSLARVKSKSSIGMEPAAFSCV